jgi:hypothetical protein
VNSTSIATKIYKFAWQSAETPEKVLILNQQYLDLPNFDEDNFFESGCFYERNSYLHSVSTNSAQKSTIIDPNVTALFFFFV